MLSESDVISGTVAVIDRLLESGAISSREGRNLAGDEVWAQAIEILKATPCAITPTKDGIYSRNDDVLRTLRSRLLQRMASVKKEAMHARKVDLLQIIDVALALAAVILALLQLLKPDYSGITPRSPRPGPQLPADLSASSYGFHLSH